MSDEGSPQAEAAFRSAMVNARLAQGVSQTELARRLTDMGLPFRQQMIQRMETGDRAIRLNEAVALSRVLGLSLDSAMTGDLNEPLDDAIEEFLRLKVYDVGTLAKSANVVRDRARDLSADMVRARYQFDVAAMGSDESGVQAKIGYLNLLHDAVGAFQAKLADITKEMLRVTAIDVKRRLNGEHSDDA